jgi:hypothetical protein
VLAGLALMAVAVPTQNASAASAQAMDLWGKFVSFKDGVLTFDIPSGKLAGTKSINVPNGVPVLVFTSPGHPTRSSSPVAFENVPADTSIEVNVNSTGGIFRISLGDKQPGKKK